MCGIIGYVGPRVCKPLLLQGLQRLEYRGYDSAGLALLEDDGLDYLRAVGNLQELKRVAESHRELRESLIAEGHTYSSETDAEVVTHLIERYYEGDFAAAVRKAYAQLEGHFSIVAIHHDHPGVLVGARCQTPLVVGVGDGE